MSLLFVSNICHDTLKYRQKWSAQDSARTTVYKRACLYRFVFHRSRPNVILSTQEKDRGEPDNWLVSSRCHASPEVSWETCAVSWLTWRWHAVTSWRHVSRCLLVSLSNDRSPSAITSSASRASCVRTSWSSDVTRRWTSWLVDVITSVMTIVTVSEIL